MFFKHTLGDVSATSPIRIISFLFKNVAFEIIDG